MRVLFYLPGITDRFFDAVVLPLLQRMTAVAEVHVMGPPEWQKTGLTEHQLMQCADLPEIQWHILDGDDHETLRTAPADPDALVDHVRGIDPDYTFCRGADVATPSRFPGKTRFMMEAAIPPVALRPGLAGSLILDGPGLYDQGFMPALTDEERTTLDTLFAPAWAHTLDRFVVADGAKARWFRQVGLPLDRKVIALPLNAEASNNFFLFHSLQPSSARLIETLARKLDDDVVLAVTQHPLNLRGDPDIDLSVEMIEPVIARLGDRVRLVTTPGPVGNATTTLLQHCDGAIICESKAFGLAAFFGKPVQRFSRFASAPWMHAYTDMADFLAAIRSGGPKRPDEDGTRLFMAYHYANEVFAASDPALTAQEILARFDKVPDPGRWEVAMARLAG